MDEKREQEVRDTVNKAQEEVAALCQGRKWRMSIPVDEEKDSDIVIDDALRNAHECLDAIADMRKALVLVKRQRDNNFRERAALIDECDKLRAENEQYKGYVEDRDKTIMELLAHMDELRGELERLFNLADTVTKDRDRLLRRLAKVEDERNHFRGIIDRGDIGELRGENERLQARYEKRDRWYKDQLARAEKAEAAIASMRTENERLRKERDDRKAFWFGEVNKWEVECTSLRGENEQLRKMIKEGITEEDIAETMFPPKI